MQSFLMPEKTSPDITILLCIKIILNVFYIENTFVFVLPLCATLEDIRNFLMLCTKFTQTFSGKCRNYRLRVIQILIPRRSAGSDSSVC